MPRPALLDTLCRPLLATVLAFGTLTMTAAAQTPAGYAVPIDGTLLSVSAQAEARRVPDIATISAGVVTQASDANAAMRANAQQMEKVMAAIRAAGIGDRDIQTSGISVNPQYRYAENVPPTITGYQASNTVNLKVRDVAKLGKVLDALVASGANQVNGPSFEIDQPEAVYDEARRAGQSAGARTDVRQNAGAARAPDRQHQRGRRFPAADADDGDAHGEGAGRHRSLSGRNHADRQSRRRIRAGALTCP